jgi:hypothetical protein
VRVLLAENMPEALVDHRAPEAEARTVQQEGWRGRKNGDLLSAAAASFDVFITTDQGIPHQQNSSRYKIAIMLREARSNRIEDLAPLIPEMKARPDSVAPGTVTRVAV